MGIFIFNDCLVWTTSKDHVYQGFVDYRTCTITLDHPRNGKDLVTPSVIPFSYTVFLKTLFHITMDHVTALVSNIIPN